MYFLHKTILQGIIEKWLGSNDVIIDTETTGLTEDDEIIEIAIINMRGEVLLNTLVKPTRNIPADVINIHHITNEMVASAPSWAEIYPQVMEIFGHRKWLAWNSKFDARLITQTSLITGQYDGLSAAEVIHEYNRIHHSQIDAKRTYSEWYGEFEEVRQSFKRQHLAAAVAQQNVVVDGAAHRALADCFMVLGVLKAAAKGEARTLTMKLPEDTDPRDAFEKVFPIPAHVSRCGKGYAVHEYNAWSAHDYVKKWDGWNACCRAAMLAAVPQEQQ